jgi:hypothetical protein
MIPVMKDAKTPTKTIINPRSEIKLVLNGGSKIGLILLPTAICNP